MDEEIKKEKLLLIGSGGFGRVVSEQARQKYECAFVDDGFAIGTKICDIPVVGPISDLKELRKEYSLLIVTIGNNKLREQIYENAMELGYTFPNIVCESAYVSPYSHMGWGCVLLQNSLIQNGASIGNGVLLNPGVEIHHDSTVDDYVLVYTNSVVRTYAKVGKRVRVGSNVTICNESIVDVDEDVPDGISVNCNMKVKR